jgi:DNA replication protein DnaC
MNELEAALTELKLPAFVSKYQDAATACTTQNAGHIGYLQLLVNAELEDRYHKRIKKLLQSLVNELATGNFLHRAENLLIFGNSGTGKTHLVMALVEEWCNRGRKVLFMTAAELIQELLKAKRKQLWNEYIRSLNRNEALVIDDISYVACDKHETDLLFLLLASRYENKSLVITSNLPLGEWSTIFKDEITTKAAVDRLVHHSTILRLNAESYRKESAQKRQEEILQKTTS